MSENSQLNVTDLFARLSAPFPPEACETDDSRGFALTGIKGAYVIERLNQVLGLCGTGWAFSISKIEVCEKFVLADIEFQYCVGGQWSKPIPVSSDQMIVRGRVGDAKKGAVTDAIKKGAGYLGVGNEAYKGLLSAPANGNPRPRRRKAAGKSEPAQTSAKRTPTSDPKPAAEKHWIDRPEVRRRFWAWTKTELGLDESTVYAMLGVGKIHDFPGTMQEARARIETALTMSAVEATITEDFDESKLEY